MSMLHALADLTSTMVLTASDPQLDPDDVKPGWLGFAVFLAMAAATALILWSFVRRTKKVNFVEQDDWRHPAAPGDDQIADEPRTAEGDARSRPDTPAG
ncbi:hypothetical protein [Solicola sp. PLA-1-18]|uniref:hypothetical protein n=1 Tax=Solicola sp. PLA-1-18 TaxID=3380532 RepID=UPI003B7F9EA3